MSNNVAVIHTDGGARGNPGPAAIGVVIDWQGNRHTISQTIGSTTNNQAEYRAVLAALAKAQELGISDLELRLDSQLVCEQLKGNYKVKEPGLQELFRQAVGLIKNFHSITFTFVRREQNKEADALVNKALDSD